MTDVRKIADDIFNSIQSTIQEAKLVNTDDGFDLKDIRAALSVVDLVLTEVERLSKDISVGTLSGKDKKDIASDVLARLITVDLPFVPNVVEGKVKRVAISFIIDYSVEFLNRKLGKEWLR